MMSTVVAAQDAQTEADAASSYKLAAGDRVRVTVYGHEDLSGDFEIDGTGHITLPLIRDVRAVGQSTRELAESIADRLQPEYLKNPRVSAEVLDYRPFYIIGEVKSPGSYPYVNGITVINAVAVAGGYTYRARKGRFKIIRETEVSRREIRAKPDTPVLPGDVIEIAERFF
jgi:polysaccharide export outer membrane protein